MPRAPAPPPNPTPFGPYNKINKKKRINLTNKYSQIFEHNIVYKINCLHVQLLLLIRAFFYKDLNKKELV